MARTRVVCAVLVALALAAPWAWAAPSPPSVQVERGVVYGTAAGVTLLLDAYLQPGAGPHPAVVVVHGGGWVQGSRTSGGVRLMAPPLLSAGYAVFSIDYRLAPVHPYPAAIEDARRAVRFVRANAGRFRIDPGRVAIAGASAGGHIVALIGTTACEGAAAAPDPVNRQPCRPRAVLNFFGPTDLRGRFGRAGPVRAFLGARTGPEHDRLAAEASPVTHASRDDPPQMLLHGERDPLVPYDQSVRFVDAARAAGMTVELVTIPGGGHGVRGWREFEREWTSRMLRWLAAYDG